MPTRLRSPYPSSWRYALRGNLHTHSTVSDGTRPPQEVIDDYAARGYDFLMFSDHDRAGAREGVDARGMLLLPGVEISADGPHLLQVGVAEPVAPVADRQQVIDAVLAAGGFVVANHPNWQGHFNHFPQELLEKLQGYNGIEIYNGCIRRLEGSPLATDRWDMLLSRGRVVWGHGTDDAHRPEHTAIAWDVALVMERTAADVLTALREGSFYASTGVAISRIAVAGDTLYVQAPGAGRMVAVSSGGCEIAAIAGSELTLHLTAELRAKIKTYVRVECYGEGGAMAWTQPFLIEDDAEAEGT